MPSILRERMEKLMAEQAAEAPLPTSRAVMDFGDKDEVEPPEEAEPMDMPPLPETADFPEQEMMANQENDAEPVEDIEPPKAEDGVELPDPGWEDAIDDMQSQFGGDVDIEEHQPVPADWGDEMSWQQALVDRE